MSVCVRMDGCMAQQAVVSQTFTTSHPPSFTPSFHTTHSPRYVQMASGPIIEDCNGMRFAPYTLEYPGLGDQVGWGGAG